MKIDLSDIERFNRKYIYTHYPSINGKIGIADGIGADGNIFVADNIGVDGNIYVEETGADGNPLIKDYYYLEDVESKREALAQIESERLPDFIKKFIYEELDTGYKMDDVISGLEERDIPEETLTGRDLVIIKEAIQHYSFDSGITYWDNIENIIDRIKDTLEHNKEEMEYED